MIGELSKGKGGNVTWEARYGPATPAGIDLRDCWPGLPAYSGRVVRVGVGVVAAIVLVGLAITAGAFATRTVGAALLGGSQGQMRSGSAVTTASQLGSLKLQGRLVEQRREAVATYAAQLTEFKAATARRPGDVGINLSAREIRRRDEVLTGLVLHCMDAVGQYNVAAQALPVTQLQSAGLPERLAWAVDCASGP